MRIKSSLRAVSAIAAIGLLAAGCGFGSSSTSSGGTSGGTVSAATSGGSIKPIASLKGVTFKVGSKDFDEQLVLGQIAILALKAAGANPVDKTNIQGTVNTRRALTSGNIDMYWEYTGTAWITFLGHTTPIKGRMAQWQAVAKEDLSKNGIKWLNPAPMNNTYALATTQKVAAKLGVSKLSDLAKLPASDLTFCLESEFASRSDGFKPMAKDYGFLSKVGSSQIKILDTGLVYSQLAKGGVCNFGEVFTTDGRIAALNLKVLQDDKSFFPLYNVAVTMKDSLFKKYPDLATLFDPISAKLTTEALQGMNKKVSVDGETPKAAATAWMKSEGFIG